MRIESHAHTHTSTHTHAQKNKCISHSTVAATVATNTQNVNTHTLNRSVFFDTALRPRITGLWNSPITSKVLYGLSSFSPCVKQLCLRHTWLEYLSRVMCLCFSDFTLEIGRRTRSHACTSTLSQHSPLQHCWYHTRLYDTPQHI